MTGGEGFSVHCADALEAGPWHRKEGFDRILVDAPCSGTGILRRQPDIRLLRHSEELAKLSALRERFFASLFPAQGGGRLVHLLRATGRRGSGDRKICQWETPEATSAFPPGKPSA